jgi:hypothetical protein
VGLFNARIGRMYNDNVDANGNAPNQAVKIDPFTLTNVFVNLHGEEYVLPEREQNWLCRQQSFRQPQRRGHRAGSTRDDCGAFHAKRGRSLDAASATQRDGFPHGRLCAQAVRRADPPLVEIQTWFDPRYRNIFQRPAVQSERGLYSHFVTMPTIFGLLLLAAGLARSPSRLPWTAP